MKRMYRYLLVLGILVLIIIGLNTSNQGINSLTLENRQPVLGLETQNNELKIYTMGKIYCYNEQEMRANYSLIRQQIGKDRHAASDYLLRVERILQAMFD